MKEVQDDTRSALPEDTEHRDLIAQLGARITMDAVDTNERSKKVAARRLSRTEWVGSAKELAKKP